MNRSTLTAAALIASLTVAAPVLQAQRRERPERGRPPVFAAFSHIEELSEELSLTEEQVSQIRGIFRELHELNAPYREEMRGGLGTAFQSLLQNPDDVAGAQAAVDRQSQAERAISMNTINATANALKVLSAEQRTQLAQLLEERRDKRRERQ